jgi:DNA-binding MarR family transcriptional regulator
VPHASRDRNLGQLSATAPTMSASELDLHPKHWIRRFPALSPRMTALMIEGDKNFQYGSSDSRSSKTTKSNHSHAVVAASAAACARFGWSQAQFVEAMLDTPSTAGQHARRMVLHKDRDHAVNYVERVWERAETLVESKTMIAARPDAILDLIALRDRISSADCWRGIAGSTALRVLMAHWHAAKRSGGRMYTLSHREAAEIAGCTTRTAYVASTKRLAGWLKLVESGSGDKGSTWLLLDGHVSQQRHSSMGAQPEGGTPSVSNLRNGDLDGSVIERLMSLDAFAHRGLGSSSLKLISALSLRDGQSAAELMENAMVSQATAYRHLNRLATYDLVLATDGLWTLTEKALEALRDPQETWDTVAFEIGTYGTSWRRQQLHKAEREVWNGMVLPRMRERRMPNVVPIRGDEVDAEWILDDQVVDPVTGEIIPDLVVACDGRLMMVVEEPDYEELVRRNTLACAA